MAITTPSDCVMFSFLPEFADFFFKNGVAVLTVKELFEFITDPLLDEGNVDSILADLATKAAERSHNERTTQEKLDEEVGKIFVFSNEIKPRNCVFSSSNKFTSHISWIRWSILSGIIKRCSQERIQMFVIQTISNVQNY